jgi:hypothetical protein
VKNFVAIEIVEIVVDLRLAEERLEFTWPTASL